MVQIREQKLNKSSPRTAQKGEVIEGASLDSVCYCLAASNLSFDLFLWKVNVSPCEYINAVQRARVHEDKSQCVKAKASTPLASTIPAYRMMRHSKLLRLFWSNINIGSLDFLLVGSFVIADSRNLPDI